MQGSFLFDYLQDGHQFIEWIVQSTALSECVESWLMALWQVQDTQVVVYAVDLSGAEKMMLLLNGRNAAQDLQAVASDGGFETTAQAFYNYYVHCCRALLCIDPLEGVA